MLTRATVERVWTYYDLGDIRTFSIAPHGTVNETAFVGTSHGRFVVRRNQQRLGRADMGRRHAVCLHLAQRGLPVPTPYPTRNRQSAAELDGRLYEVSQFVAGEEFHFERPQMQFAIGGLLARYHIAIQDYPAGPPPDQPRYSPSIALGLIERLLERDVMGDLAHELSWYDRRVVDLRRSLPPSAAERLPHLLIHGDIHRDNVLFQADEIAALLDFDQIGCDARLTDLVDGLIAFASDERRPGWSPWGAYRGPLDVAAAGRVLAGYQQVLSLSPNELAALPILIEGAWLQGELRRVMSTPDGAPEYHQEVLNQGKVLAQWLDQQREALFALLTSPIA